ncbi:hypothetical protein ACFL34_06155 [Candidatus Sumerlaeota bacterium]
MPEPLVMVKPERTQVVPSAPTKVTTEPLLLPSMMVVATMDGLVGSVDRRTIFLPPKWMFYT